MQANGECDRQTLIRLRHAASKAAQDGAEAARLAFVMAARKPWRPAIRLAAR